MRQGQTLVDGVEVATEVAGEARKRSQVSCSTPAIHSSRQSVKPDADVLLEIFSACF
jgi:hypothetical protein